MCSLRSAPAGKACARAPQSHDQRTLRVSAEYLADVDAEPGDVMELAFVSKGVASISHWAAGTSRARAFLRAPPDTSPPLKPLGQEPYNTEAGAGTSSARSHNTRSDVGSHTERRAPGTVLRPHKKAALPASPAASAAPPSAPAVPTTQKRRKITAAPRSATGKAHGGGGNVAAPTAPSSTGARTRGRARMAAVRRARRKPTCPLRSPQL